MVDILPELNNKDYINSIFQDYDVHFCRESEVDELVEFIDNYWKKNHIFVLSRELLDWQHYDACNKRYNFVVARHRDTGAIHSIMGFVFTNHFDSEIHDGEVWICIWKSREDIHRKGLGTSLYYYLKKNFDVKAILLLGISKTNKACLNIHKRWEFKTGETDQYYLPNMHHREILTKNRHCKKNREGNQPGWKLKELSLAEYEQIDVQNSAFEAIDRYKSKKFFVNRYYKHPVYKYIFWGLWQNTNVAAIVITRECGNDVSTCLRIVDFIGDLACLSCVKADLQTLMIERNYEYIDFVVGGSASEAVKGTGFINRRDNPKTIVPHYFEPLLQENVDLDFAYKTVDEDCSFNIFKGDADQDRPNSL